MPYKDRHVIKQELGLIKVMFKNILYICICGAKCITATAEMDLTELYMFQSKV